MMNDTTVFDDYIEPTVEENCTVPPVKKRKKRERVLKFKPAGIFELNLCLGIIKCTKCNTSINLQSKNFDEATQKKIRLFKDTHNCSK